MNRPASLSMLLIGLGIGLAGCGGSKATPAKEEAASTHEAEPAKSAIVIGPVAPAPPVMPSPVPSLPTNPRGDMATPEATRPGNLPSEDSRKEGARPPEPTPGATPSTPK